MDKIFMKRLSFYGYHGAYAEENRLGQRFYVDLEMKLDLKPAGTTDDLQNTVDYGAVYQKVETIMTGTRVKLIETLAERIAGRLLADFPIEEVRVRVTKPNPPIQGHYESVGVEVVRTRT
ncbi:dihydroneopterin aldolase [Thermoactinomyces intermedius]|uniref:7,8-dihydroneopterin aldolase n=1 Tax=Thermoactinomyces intermedius TaxID=2024 RepID=A0A8I1DF24_THEIN|nr:dihydroneopterin aldolase [Thermoactinomyces intermedius]MBA4549323.1 dihydroneopterin aldolase [Thermoactinomyces intermedius]MBA4835387.1 dihydroneopterin aldolase [Thermoactinomyces intermedius]MBH8595604.1 dihydroneopterin aldolase [Thermoactinomyces intermedius]MBH8600629.1 dihydroneopterin aldolase [Thermoactinomyces sp. CICC 23799]